MLFYICCIPSCSDPTAVLVIICWQNKKQLKKADQQGGLTAIWLEILLTKHTEADTLIFQH